MNSTKITFTAFAELLFRNLPRFLSQLDRDAHSPTFGCFDRDFWHYKMRDFSSVVLQQGMLVLEVLHDYSHDSNTLYRYPLARTWADACLHFWLSRQRRCGAFEEYFPFEAGYPPTAFSLYAIGVCLRRRVQPLDPPLARGIQKAVDWLLAHQEHQALNQEAAGLAALALLADIPGIQVDPQVLGARLDAFFAAQDAEGWFPEYGGADIGYLSVTLDCLWDYYEATGDNRAMTAMDRAVGFIAVMLPVAGQPPVMTNSRNTNYVVPYGLIRLAAQNPMAKRIVERLFGQVGRADHFLHSMDDRYLCHYIYQSCIRGLVHLEGMTREHCLLPCEGGAKVFLPSAGMHIRHVSMVSSLIIAGKKGGVVYAYSVRGLTHVDFGWRERRPDGSVMVTHWQNPETTVNCDSSASSTILCIEGPVTTHTWLVPTVVKHLLLRVMSFLGGRRLIPVLKRGLIFKAPKTGLQFQRQINIDEERMTIRDTFRGKNIASFSPAPAPSYSLRHVASAATFSTEDLLLEPTQTRELIRGNDYIQAERSFPLKEQLPEGTC